MKLSGLMLLSAMFAIHAQAQSASRPPEPGPSRCEVPADLAARLGRVPPELMLFGGKLRIVNVFKRQAETLLDTSANDEQLAARWSAEVYPLHAAFWVGYVGDSTAFATLAKGLMPHRRKLLCEYVPKLLALDLNERFVRHATWLQQQTGMSPAGTWYLAYGSGATDMGGLGALGMVIDFSNQVADSVAIERLLTHELAHQIHGQRADPDGDTVLGRIIAEGLATYVACVHAGDIRSPADCIGYSDTEWQWAMRHEAELRAFAKPRLRSRARSASDSIASRSIAPVAGSPGAIGYFLGYRLVASYTRRFGANSWPALLVMPVRDVLRRSRYRL